ncbi:MAG: hypothetical protein GX417_09895 [Clostridiales bacterium]|nr:hypothetical protein [Clostridiales bacterium]
MVDDRLLSLLVILGAALAAGAIFLLTRRAARRREEALAAYCALHGYRLTTNRAPTAREIALEGDGWRLTSSMRALQSTAQAGSSDWRRETEFVCGVSNPMRQTLALQVSGGSTGLEALPSQVREAAITALRRRLGGEFTNLASVRTAFCEGRRCGVVLETDAHTADAALELLHLPLSAWRGGLPLYLACSPAQIRLNLPDCMVQSVEETDALLRIGLALY